VSGPFTSRPLGALDLDLASALHGEAFAALGERAWTRQEIAELLASPGVAGLLLKKDENEIGFALCRTAADEAELLTIAVRPSHRRLGAGRELLGMVIDLARRRGVRSIFLEVGADNPAAQALYERAGFLPIGRRAAYYNRGNRPAADAIVMRLALE
jgi:[ribosomal protein S18]-alanine N-acetyltransferase